MQVLRKYQLLAVDGLIPAALASICSATHRVRRVLAVSPCGSGKSSLIAEICRRALAKGTRVLLVAPRRKLVRQLAERLTQFGVAYGVLMADLPHQSEPWAVLDSTALVQIASRDTLFARQDTDGILSFDMVIFDEAHLLSERFRGVEAATGCRVVIGFTATACKPDGSGLSARYWHVLVVVTTIEHLLSLDPPCLVPVDVFAPVGVAARRRRGLAVNCSGDPVRQWLNHADGLRTVTFCRTVAESLAVRNAFLDAGVSAAHLDANTPDDERESVIARLVAGEVKVVTNVDIVGLGVDVPELECVQLLTKCVSPIRLWQCVGRCQRPAPGKVRGVLLDHAAATSQHGLPNVSPVWTLDERDSVQARAQRTMDESPGCRPATCKTCGLVSAGAAACPGCGARLFGQKTEAVKTDREPLRLYTGEGGPGGGTGPGEAPKPPSRFQATWTKLLYMAAGAKWTCGRAGAMFKKDAGQFPDAAGVTPTYSFDQKDLLVAELWPHFVRRRKGDS